MELQKEKEIKSSYQKRIDDLIYVWDLLSDIRDNLIKKHDGFTDEEIIKKITRIIDDNFDIDINDAGSCPICGRFSVHCHSFE